MRGALPPFLPKVIEVLLFVLILGLYGVQYRQMDVTIWRQQTALAPNPPPAERHQGSRIFVEPDSYTWLTFAKEMVATGAVRINYTDSDNPPEGREAHWNSLLTWILVAAGWLRHVMTGEPIYQAIEWGAYQVNLVQFLAAVALWYGLMRRALGRWPTMLGLVILAWAPANLWCFHPGRPDHQTLHFLAAFATVLLILRGGVGWARVNDLPPGSTLLPLPTEAEAATFFRWAGFAAAFGIWVGATVQLTVLFFTGCVAILLLYGTPAEAFARSRARGYRYIPSVWVEWALVGAISTVGFYLVQYFPADMRMRLEAIHPLYAVSWLGGGWLLTILASNRVTGSGLPFGEWRFWASIVLVLAWPLATRLGPADWHILRDELIVRFQTRTTEGMPLPMHMGKEWLRGWLQEVTILPLLLLIVPLLANARRMNRPSWTVLLFCWMLAMGYVLLGYWQGRWLMFVSLSFVVLAPIVLIASWRVAESLKGRVAAGFVTVLILAGVTFYAVRAESLRGLLERNSVLLPGVMDGVYLQRLSHLLRKAGGGEDVRVLADPTFAPGFYYFTGVMGIGSLFWQNADGLRDTRDFFVATNDGDAARIAKRRELDFVVAMVGKGAITFPVYLKYGEKMNQEDGDFLVSRLVDGGPELPEWLKEDYSLSNASGWPMQASTDDPVPEAHVYRIRQDLLP